MLDFLKNHPFAVETYFEQSTVLAYAVRKEELGNLIPECLELDTFADKWAFIAIALVQTRNLRPKGFPAFLGRSFFLIGYRVFVRYTTSKGRRLRGLFILRSETDNRFMAVSGNIFTHYNYQTTDINLSTNGDRTHITSGKSALDIEVEIPEAAVPLPKGSPFPDWKAARKFAGPLPFTFTYNPPKREVLLIEGVRQNWVPTPVNVLKSKTSFMDSLQLKTAVLANAFVVNNIPYHWKSGIVDPWRPQES